MIDESLLKSNFLGRDGFRWWIGQVAPIESQEDQANGGGWGNRVKVRILGYHPYSESDLSNNDLPWAQVLLSTTSGSGAGGCATSTKLKQGDVVFGFFLDGDNAQIPVVMGCFGRTSDISTGSEPYSSPFVPFTGYTTRVKKPTGTLKGDETNENNSVSQKSPRDVPPNIINRLNTENPFIGEVPYFTGVGKTIVFGNSCSDTALSGTTAEIDNLLQRVRSGFDNVNNVSLEVSRSVEKITSIMNTYVGRMMGSLYTELIPVLQQGLRVLYELVYGAVLAATGNERVAHLSGVAAQTAMVFPVKNLEEGLHGISGQVVNNLSSSIEELLLDVIDNVDNLVTCASSQFSGAILNNTIDSLLGTMNPLLGGVDKLLSLVGFDPEQYLRSGLDSIQTIGGLFDTNQSQTKCSGISKEWVIGKGIKDPGSETRLYASILENMNVAASIGKVSSDPFQQKYGTWDIFSGISGLSNTSCYTGPPLANKPPQVRIFGGGGTGARGAVILGSLANTEKESISQLQTASIIGVDITDGGSNYRYPPFVEFYDESKQGYGAIGRAIIDSNPDSEKYGQVIGIYMTSIGENYPVGDIDLQVGVSEKSVENYGVIDVIVITPGINYSPEDIAIDNFGNQYNLTIDNGRIVSARVINTIRVEDLPTISIQSDNGQGAVLKPIIGKLNLIPSPQITRIVDCPI
jgi:hypothetical protein